MVLSCAADERIDVAEISSVFVIVEAMTDDESVGNGETDIIGLEAGDFAGFFFEQ